MPFKKTVPREITSHGTAIINIRKITTIAAHLPQQRDNTGGPHGPASSRGPQPAGVSVTERGKPTLSPPP